MFRSLFLIGLFLSFTLRCCALELNPEDAHILKKFFQAMLLQTEGGYTIYGKKPVCIHGFRIEDRFVNENEQHMTEVALREGALKWKSLHFENPPQNILIHVYNQPDTLAKNFRHILFINKKLFLDTVEASLPLFQYVLGPDVTPSKLLVQLMDPEKSFHSVLKNDKVLIGIVLGFGVENSLYVSRIEDLEAGLFATEKVPFKSIVAHLAEEKPEFGQMLLTTNASSSDCFHYTSSFGYGSLKEEVKGLTQQIDISSLKLAREKPAFIFGRLKNHKETDRFVEELQLTQSKIQLLLSSKTFLENVIQLIAPYETVHFNSEENLNTPKQLSYIVAANIWKNMADEGATYQQAFIEGMKDAEKQINSKNNVIFPFKYEQLKALLDIQTNLQESKIRFQKLENDPEFKAILPHMLYYKTVENGSGPLLENHTGVTAHFLIKTPDDQILVDTWKGGKPDFLDLSTTITGFAWSMKGMKAGETREIYIHPRLAYGIFTTLEKGIYLKALVQLISFDEKSIGEFPPLMPLNIDEKITLNLQEEYQEEAKRLGHIQGMDIWNHYKKGKGYTLDEIVEWILSFQSGASADISSENSQNTIYRLHWDIYNEFE